MVAKCASEYNMLDNCGWKRWKRYKSYFRSKKISGMLCSVRLNAIKNSFCRVKDSRN